MGQRDIDLCVAGMAFELGVAVVLGVACENDCPLAESYIGVTFGIWHGANAEGERRFCLAERQKLSKADVGFDLAQG